MRVVVGGVALDHGRELARGAPVAAAAEVRAAERLADRGLVRLQPLRLLERHGRLCPVALLEQRDPALEERIGVLLGGSGRAARLVAHRRLPSRGRAPPADPQLLHEVEHPDRHVLLGAAGHVQLARLAQDRDLVVVGVEADVGARDVVHHDRVERLALELRAGALDSLGAVLGGEADEDLSLAALRRGLRQHVGRRARAPPRGSRAPPSRSSRPRGAPGRKSATAAAISRRSTSGRRASVASRSSSAVCTSTYLTPGVLSSAVLAAITVTSAPRRAASAASAKPIRPLERLPTNRTASSGSRVPPAVTSTRMPSSGRGAPPANISIASRIAAGSARRPTPHSPRDASGPVPGVDHVHSAVAQHVQVRLRGRVLVHVVVHRGRDAAPGSRTQDRRR